LKGVMSGSNKVGKKGRGVRRSVTKREIRVTGRGEKSARRALGSPLAFPVEDTAEGCIEARAGKGGRGVCDVSDLEAVALPLAFFARGKSHAFWRGNEKGAR